MEILDDRFDEVAAPRSGESEIEYPGLKTIKRRAGRRTLALRPALGSITPSITSSGWSRKNQR